MDSKLNFDNIVFYKVNEHYINIVPYCCSNKIILPEKKINQFETKTMYKSEQLVEILGVNIPRGRYKFHKSKNYIFFSKESYLTWIYSLINNDYYKTINKLSIEKFRHKQKELLLNEVMSDSSNIYSIMKSLSDYTFSCHFSLWNYDKELQLFSCLASSFIDAGKVITNEPNSSLVTSIESNQVTVESRAINKDSLLYDNLSDLEMKYLNRLIIHYGESKTAIATFYSKHDNFNFNNDLSVRISSSIKNKLVALLEASHDKYEKFTKTVTYDLETISLKEYTDNFLNELCHYFSFYSAGIFIHNGDHLEELSSCGSLSNNEDLLNSIAVTLKERKKFIFYNKSQAINEPESESFKNEPIKSVQVGSFFIDELEFCFITTKKLENEIRVKLPFFYGDDSMDRVSDFLEFNIRVLCEGEKIRSELDRAKNFMKVWRHEIRSPISKFNLGSDVIKMLINKVDFEEDLRKKITTQLDDIKLLGNRLKQLTDAYSFEFILNDENRVLERVFVLKDVVIPIINSSKEFALKQHGLELIIEHHSLKSVALKSDIKLLNMALNAIVDNAMKYSSQASEIIKISGKKIDKYFCITVSNKGAPIDDSDLEIIFTEGGRGSNARKQHIDGTGIGLFIAKKVIEYLGGNIKLSSNIQNNIEFSILIPTEGEYK